MQPHRWVGLASGISLLAVHYSPCTVGPTHLSTTDGDDLWNCLDVTERCVYSECYYLGPAGHRDNGRINGLTAKQGHSVAYELNYADRGTLGITGLAFLLFERILLFFAVEMS